MKTQNHKTIRRWISIAIVAGAVVMGFVVLDRTNYYPRTDDAEIFANFIGIAPQVDGPLVRLDVKNNRLVRTGDLLCESISALISMHWKTGFRSRLALKGKSQMSSAGYRL